MKTSRFFYITFLLMASICRSASANEVLVDTQDGEIFIFEVDPTESLQHLQDKIVALTEGKRTHVLVELTDRKRENSHKMKVSARSQGSYLGYPRNYYVEVNHDEKSDIRFIVTTLANRSLIAIAVAKGDLEAAGNRIDHLHPFRFLTTIFCDEELKVGIRNIRGKGWVWHQFLGGLKDCLTTEMQIGNIQDEHIYHFAKNVKIDPALIIHAIYENRWDELVDLLITHIPRQGNHDRYDT